MAVTPAAMFHFATSSFVLYGVYFFRNGFNNNHLKGGPYTGHGLFNGGGHSSGHSSGHKGGLHPSYFSQFPSSIYGRRYFSGGAAGISLTNLHNSTTLNVS